MTHVAIIGAGLSGLSAAVHLAKRNHRVTLIERHKEAGGRIRRILPESNANPMDWGQHLMLGAYRETFRLLEDLGTRHRLNPVHEATPFIGSDGRRHGYRVGRLPRPLHALPGLLNLGQLSWTERLALGRAALSAKAGTFNGSKKLDHINTLDWLRKNGQSQRTIRHFWEPLVLATLNTPIEEASALLLAAVLNQGLFSAASDAVPYLWSGTLYDLFVPPAMERIRASGGAFFPQTRVLGLETDGNRVLRLQVNNSEAIEAETFLLALPPWQVANMVKDIAPLNPLRHAAEAFQPSSIRSLEFWYERPWMQVPYAALLDRRTQWVFNHQQREEASGFRVSAVISAADHSKTGSDSLSERILAEIGAAFPESRGIPVTKQLSIHAPRATFRARAGLDALRPGNRTPLANLFLAGDWTDTGLPATIESAIRSGLRAARCLSP